LYQAGSAQAAVELLFPDINGPSRDQMNQILLNYTSTGFSFTNEQNMRSLYQIQYALDPYPAKAKLFSLFEDIFSINVNPPNITFIDLQNHQKLLSENLFLSYKDLVKKIIFDPNHSGDYAMGRFLDLLNGQNINSPNENYARELLQLFLMGEYRPGDSFEN
jgi:uncharacterized protein (DUF1800 family)